MFLVHAENDGLAEPIGLFQKIGQMPRDGLRARPQRNPALEVGRPIDLIRNLPAVPIKILFARSPPGGIPLRDDPMHAVRSKKSVLDALLEAVSVNGIPKIQVRVP